MSRWDLDRVFDEMFLVFVASLKLICDLWLMQLMNSASALPGKGKQPHVLIQRTHGEGSSITSRAESVCWCERERQRARVNQSVARSSTTE